MKNVKSFIVTMLNIMLVCMVPVISIADQRMITFEMGESGQTVSYPMTQKEILEARRTDQLIEEINQRKGRNQRLVESYEQAESGITISFPMSDEEISEVKSQNQKLINHHNKMSDLQKEMEKKFEIFEMGESGHQAKFRWNTNE